MNSDNNAEISEWLIDYNLKQFEAEDAGNFEEANLIYQQITNYIKINAASLAGGTEKKITQIKQSLTNESNLIYNTIYNNKQNVNHL